MNTTPELSDLQQSVLMLMLAGQAAGMPLGPVELAEAADATEADVLRALADLVEAGLIQQPAADEHQEDAAQAAADPDAAIADEDRLPIALRAVLVALISTPEATPAELAEDVPGGQDAAAAAAAELTALYLVKSCGPDGAVRHTNDGWIQAEAEIAAGPATGDPVSLRLAYGMWATVAHRAAADGRTLSEAAAQITGV